jgi:hypothetical protein
VDIRDNAPLIAAGGGLLLFISCFLSWFGDISAWEGFDFTDVLLTAIALLAIAVGVSIATGTALNIPGGAAAALSTAGVLAFGMVATWVVEGEERKFGMFLALIGTIAIIVGALQLRGGAGTAPPRTRVAEPPPPPPPPPPPASPTV